MGKTFGFKTIEERNKFIVEKVKEGLSLDELSAHVKLSVRQIRNIIKTYRINGKIGRKIGSGRKKAISKGQAIQIKNDLRNNPFKSLRSIKSQRQIKASTKTISRYLKKTGYSYKKASKIPKLNDSHKKVRFEWAKNHEDFDWSKVVFSDECSFYLGDQTWGWSKKGERINQESMCYNPKIQIWAAMNYEGILYFKVFEGTMDSKKYLQILEDEFLPIAEESLGFDWVFQQDNARAHVANNVQNFLHTKLPDVLLWPPRSPDISPIENLWGRVKQKVYSRNPKNVEEFQTYIIDEMEQIPRNYCKNLINSMNKRVQMVIESEGNIIPY